MVITDPPYGLTTTTPTQVRKQLTAWANDTTAPTPGHGFAHKTWDSTVPHPNLWAEVYRVMKPGAHIAVFASARTQDLASVAMRHAGFEIRTSLQWLNAGKMMRHAKTWDRIDRKLVGRVNRTLDKAAGSPSRVFERLDQKSYVVDPITDEARRFEGYYTGLREGFEPIILGRKPCEGTATENALEWGTGSVNAYTGREYTGRTACNVLTPYGAEPAGLKGKAKSFSTYMYEPVAQPKERPIIETEDGKIFHPTVKPLGVMRWLVELLTPPTDAPVVLDPFVGTGTTLEAALEAGVDVIGIEREADYIRLAEKRLERFGVKATAIG